MLQLSASDDGHRRRPRNPHAVLDVVRLQLRATRATSSTRELFPNRIIVGSETFPDDIDELWRLVARATRT